MSTCAILLVKDEADVIEYTIRYLLGQVDEVVVSDNGSTDGTREILAQIASEPMDGCWLTVQDDPDPAYYQAEKTSRLAHDALERGHQWVIPCDADEFWYSTDGRRIADFLAGLAPDVAYVNAPLYNHLPTGEDRRPVCPVCAGRGEIAAGNGLGADGVEPCPCQYAFAVEQNPFLRIGWRQREHGALPKVACRLRPGLEIRQGNHSAWAPGSGLTAGGLCVRHYSWRSPAQYQRKLENGYYAYAATSLPDSVGAHWRMFGPPDEPTFGERVREHFWTWFYIENPRERPDLIYDPAPYAASVRRENRGDGDGVDSAVNQRRRDGMSEHEHDYESGGETSGEGEAPVEPVEGQEELETGDAPVGGVDGPEDAPAEEDAPVGAGDPEPGAGEAVPDGQEEPAEGAEAGGDGESGFGAEPEA